MKARRKWIILWSGSVWDLDQSRVFVPDDLRRPGSNLILGGTNLPLFCSFYFPLSKFQFRFWAPRFGFARWLQPIWQPEFPMLHLHPQMNFEDFQLFYLSNDLWVYRSRIGPTGHTLPWWKFIRLQRMLVTPPKKNKAISKIPIKLW